MKVKGMSCNGCVNKVTHALTTINGVLSVEVKLNQASVTVRYNEKITMPLHFKASIQAAGYEVDPVQEKAMS
jgi:copper chaperone